MVFNYYISIETFIVINRANLTNILVKTNEITMVLKHKRSILKRMNLKYA